MVRDALNNQASQTVTLVNPAPLIFNATATNCTTPTSCDGTITVSVSGGVPPYNFALTGPAGPVPFVFPTTTNLCVGTYTLTITDSNNCPAHLGTGTGATAAIISIGSGGGSSTPLSLTINANFGYCVTMCNYLSAVVSGGIPPYQYNFGSGWTTSAISPCLIGTGNTVNYNVCVMDAVGSTVCQIFPTLWTLYSWFVPYSVTPAYCGSCTGTITVNYSYPGTTYAINPGNPLGQTSPTFSNLCPGTYTVSVVPPPASGRCPQMINFTVVNQPGVLGVTTSVTNASCFGNCNGSVTVSATGAGPFEYSIDGGNTWVTTNTFSGLCAGSYNVQVRNTALACYGSASFTVTQPPAFNPAVTTTSPACYGQCTGVISVNVTPSPSSFYQYSLNGGVTYQTSPIFSSKCAGSYTVTVRQISSGCTTNVPVNITQPTQVTTIPNTATAPSCSAASNGSVSLTANGGTGTYNYNWLPGNPAGEGTPSVTNLTAGTYSCVVTDGAGCSTTFTTVLTAPPNPTIQLASSSNVTCSGYNNGSASVTATGGTLPYTYNWSPGNPIGDGTASVSALTAGTWSCTVTAGNPACSATQTVLITQPPGIITSVITQNNVSCYGLQDGSVSVAASGSVGPYSYSWSPVVDSDSIVNLLAAGTYTCTITDANGCTETQTFTITQPPQLLAGAGVIANVNCFGQNNGTASVVVTGGVSTYQYDWSPGSPVGDSSAQINNLSPGIYSCDITDANGCTTTFSVAITEPSQLAVASGTLSDVTCFGDSSGSTSVIVSGGTTAYQYDWLPGTPTGDGTSQITNVVAGTYTCVVTDANGCTSSHSITLTEPNQLVVVSGATSNVNCFANNTGSASVVVSGGATAYQYDWLPGSPVGDSTSQITNAVAGTYTCVVTDANGCTSSHSITVTEPNQLVVVSGATSNVNCFGNNSGSASVVVSGGTSAYQYDWLPGAPIGDGTNQITGLTSGTYTCNVTDANGCTAVYNAIVTEPTALDVVILNSTSPNCAGDSTGNVSVIANGGTPVYSYVWSPYGGVGSTATNLSGGNYTCVVSDSMGCTDSVSFSLTQPSPVNMVVESVSDADCFGTATGDANVVAFGGAGFPFQYNWQPAGGNSGSAIGLPAGSYTCTATDSLGCSDSVVVVIAEPNPLVASVTTSDENCFMCNGTASAVATGGNGGNIYYWQGIPDSAFADSLCSGTYELIVTDSLGCADTLQFGINNVITLHVDSVASAGTSIWQNNGPATVFASGSGTLNYQWDTNAGNQTTATAINLAPGNYCVVINDSAGCTDSVCVNVALITGITSSDPHEVSVYPNPFTNEINVTGYGFSQVQLIDLQGRVVQDFGSRNLTGGASLGIADDVSAGTYFLRIKFHDAIVNIKAIKQ